MGKNKKKEKKTNQPAAQDEAAGLSLSPLSISGGPSTSRDAPAAEAVPAPETLPTAETAAAAATTTTPAAAPANEPEEDGGLGLGGGGRKRPKRKPKSKAQQQEPAAPSQPTSTGDQGPSAKHGDFPAAPGPSASNAGLAFPGQASAAVEPWKTKPPTPTQAPSQSPYPGFKTQSPQQPPVGTQRAPEGFQKAPTRPTPQQMSTGPQRGQGAATTTLEVVKSRYVIPKRIEGRSVRARIIKMLVNYLPMRIKPMKVYRYDAAFKPDRPKKGIPMAFEAAIKRNFPKFIGKVAFDQNKNFYTTEPLPNVGANERFQDNIEILDDNGKVMKFEVSFKATGMVDYGTIFQGTSFHDVSSIKFMLRCPISRTWLWLVKYMNSGGTSLSPPTEAIQAIDVILRQGTLQSYVKAGRQFFKRPSNPIALGEGLEMWTGLFQSAIFTSKPFINIDVAHKGFPVHQPLMKVLDVFGLDPRKPVDTQRGMDGFLNFIKGLRVMARIGGDTTTKAHKREFICNGIADPASRQKFTMTDASGRSREITVASYFMEKGCRLQYPNQNCMWVGPREKHIYYPMEVLEVSYGQVRNRQLTERQLSTMVREAATPPNERKRKIEEVIRDMKYSQNQYFKTFGLEISEKFTEVNGKVIEAPRMKCGGPGTVNPRKGAWTADRVHVGKRMDNWGIIAVEMDPRTANVEQLESMFQNVGRQMGMEVSPPNMRAANVGVSNLENVMRTALEKKLQMLVVVVSARTRDVYSQVKKVAERSVGMLTQCIKENTASRRCNQQTIRNILLKVNSKLMGVNHVLDATSVPACMRTGNVMVVGADVTHPSPEQTNIPSIAAVTASIDKFCFKYNIEFSIQTPKVEIIAEFEDMMVDHLKRYREEQHCLPSKIYVFRDGVSEGQFALVMNSELQAVYDAHKRLSGGATRPEVMFLLVQKRHHTRFFLGDSQYNVEPGTVVDTEIVHPRELDFYLVSHQAIKGTARPTRYHAICNDGGVPHDEVEQLAFYLCHLYSRCTRSVSYPTPTYYAHLACLRARTLTHNERFDNQELERRPKRLHVKPQVQDNSPMFFV